MALVAHGIKALHRQWEIGGQLDIDESRTAVYCAGVTKKRRKLKGPIHGRIAKLREQKGWSQEQLADAVGVDKTSVSHWENKIARPDIRNLAAVADALGVTIEKLIDGEEKAA